MSAHPHLVAFDRAFRLKEASTQPPEGALTGKAAKKALEEVRDRLADLQEQLWADRRHAVLLLFQARDAAGKDSTIRHVFRGVNPAGVQVTSFGVPTEAEREHDFLWRHQLALPRRGTISVHNRTWYEEALVVRVHPQFLGGQRQRVPDGDSEGFWARRLESMRTAEQHLARNGTTVIKCFLNVSRDEQARRLLRRLERPDKHWKYNPKDMEERALWSEYDHAYEAALSATSRPWAPWYCIPADDKPYMRLCVAKLMVSTLESLQLRWPDPDPDDVGTYATHIEALRGQLSHPGDR